MPITLKAARINAGFTQAEAAAKLEISKDTLRNWERLKSFPDVAQLKKLLTVYNVCYDDILFLT